MASLDFAKPESLKAHQVIYYRAEIIAQRPYFFYAQKYKLPETFFEELMQKCNGLCAICKVKKVDYLDHCHTTGRVRGFLCKTCNPGIGMFFDNPQLLISAAKYLEMHNG